MCASMLVYIDALMAYAFLLLIHARENAHDDLPPSLHHHDNNTGLYLPISVQQHHNPQFQSFNNAFVFTKLLLSLS
jgi:hypothetical protein